MVGTEGAVGANVVGVALTEHVGDILAQLLGTLPLYQGALDAGYGKACVDDIDPGFEEHGEPLGIHILHIVEEAGGAAACGDDDIFKLGHLVQHVALNLTERFLALLGKELRHGTTVTVLDVVVEVDELQTEVTGKRLAERGLASCHETDEQDTGHIISCVYGVKRASRLPSR